MPDELNLRHREIIRLAFSGVPATRIADQVGMAVSTVRMILRSPLAQGEIARLSERAEESLTNVPMRVRLLNELNDAATDALRINAGLMNNPGIDPRVRAGIGKHFMDRLIFGREAENEREGGYREILRSLDSIERKLDPATILMPPGTPFADRGAGAASASDSEAFTDSSQLRGSQEPPGG